MLSDRELIERVQGFLAARPELAVVEKQMMGSLTFMVDGNMCCSVGNGRLMVRVGPEGYDKALTEPNVAPLEFGGRKALGYVCIDADAVKKQSALKRWLERGLAFVATLPRKPAKEKKTRPKL